MTTNTKKSQDSLNPSTPTSIILTFNGNCAPKKNSKEIRKNFKTNKNFIGSSSRYLAYNKATIKETCLDRKLWDGRKYTGSYPCVVTCFFYRKTKHVFDFDNMQASIHDMLVEMGVILDDKMDFVIPAIHRKGYAIDKNNPRTVVLIEEYKEK